MQFMVINHKIVTQQIVNFPNVKLVYLFGSHAKGQASPKSDIDIAILLKEPISNPLQTKLDLLDLFQNLVGEEVDITILNTVGSVLKYQVVKNGQLLFERSPGDHKKFQISAWKEYFDFQPTLEFFYQRKIA